MKIYLWGRNTTQWKIHDSEDKDFQQQLKDRNIFIGNSATVGDYAKVGYSATVGDYAKVGNSATVGDYAKVGYYAKVGDYATVGYSATVGDYATVGNSATVGDYAKVGNSATVGDYATVGNYAKVGDYATVGNNFNQDGKDTFSLLNILIMTGVLIQDGEGIFYKDVQPDLTDFHSGKYQYKEGGKDIKRLKRNQDIACGEGWHWTSYERAVAFAGGRPHKIISAKIKLKDILSVYNKVRVKAFSGVKIVNL